MDSDQIARLAYLVLLTAAIAGYFLLQNRQRLGQLAQQAAIWGLIFLGVIAGLGLWSDIRSTVMPRQAVFADQGKIEVPRGPDGHFYMTVRVNGAPLRFVVDTGASEVVLTKQDAAQLGFDPASLSYIGSASTANGTVSTAPVRLDTVTLGPFTDRNVRAWVNGGPMDMSLLGNSYLRRFGKIEITGDKLVLIR
ncbi:MAG: TIGR02281 family clan AA aspartic protease [Paracoccaceae bacterium]